MSARQAVVDAPPPDGIWRPAAAADVPTSRANPAGVPAGDARRPDAAVPAAAANEHPDADVRAADGRPDSDVREGEEGAPRPDAGGPGGDERLDGVEDACPADDEPVSEDLADHGTPEK